MKNLLIVLFLLTITSCKKEEDVKPIPDITKYYIETEIKIYENGTFGYGAANYKNIFGFKSDSLIQHFMYDEIKYYCDNHPELYYVDNNVKLQNTQFNNQKILVLVNKHVLFPYDSVYIYLNLYDIDLSYLNCN